MDLLATGIILDEGYARELVEFAQQMKADGHILTANSYLSLSRRHKVKAIEARAKLAALSAKYDYLLNGDLLQDPSNI